VRVFWALTVASAVTFCWVLWVFVQAYPFGSLHPFVWCLRDMSKRSFPDSAIYGLNVMREQRPSR
jgi:hypothetical protein